MQAPQLMETLTTAGLDVSLTPDYGLKVKPAKALTDDLRASIKMHKAVLVDYLRYTAANDPSVARQELIEKPSGIMECDSGIEPTQTETMAKLHTDYLLHHWRCLTCCAAGQGSGQRCAVGADLWIAYELGLTP